MLTTYTVIELLVARQPLRRRHPSGRPVNGSLGARGCPERRALALGLLILRAQRRAIAAQCTCGGLRHHRATCPASSLCAGCTHAA